MSAGLLRPIAALALLAAGPAATLQPGRWQVATEPGAASLDGKRLDDLPYTGPAGPETVCLSSAQARDPAAWLARDLAPGCTLSRRSLAQGRVDLAGSCPPQADGLPRGQVQLTGRWTATSYDLRFTTTNPSENGVMGFTGTMTGRRVGACPN